MLSISFAIFVVIVPFGEWKVTLVAGFATKAVMDFQGTFEASCIPRY